MNTLIKAALSLVLASGIYVGYQRYMVPIVDTAVAVESKAAAAVAAIDKVDASMKAPVRVYKSSAKTKLALPAAVIADPDKEVVSATTIKSSERPQTVTTVIDAGTGESTTYTKFEPMPWIAVENRGEVRFDYGYKFKPNALSNSTAGRFSIRQDVLAIKALHLGVNASMDTDGAAFVGAGIGYRW